MKSTKLTAGERFPSITVEKLGGGSIDLAKPSSPHDWRMVIVYRGQHCPICTSYLTTLNTLLTDFHQLGVDVVAVSADPLEKTQQQLQKVQPRFEVGYGLTIEQMQMFGLYISHPRSEAETDRPFSEPGLFVINGEGTIQIIDISNAPFARPELKSMLMGLTFIRNPENNYPIRGTYE